MSHISPLVSILSLLADNSTNCGDCFSPNRCCFDPHYVWTCCAADLTSLARTLVRKGRSVHYEVQVQSTGLSVGAAVGIFIGITLGLALVGVLVCWGCACCCFRSRGAVIRGTVISQGQPYQPQQQQQQMVYPMAGMQQAYPVAPQYGQYMQPAQQQYVPAAGPTQKNEAPPSYNQAVASAQPPPLPPKR